MYIGIKMNCIHTTSEKATYLEINYKYTIPFAILRVLSLFLIQIANIETVSLSC